ALVRPHAFAVPPGGLRPARSRDQAGILCRRPGDRRGSAPARLRPSPAHASPRRAADGGARSSGAPFRRGRGGRVRCHGGGGEGLCGMAEGGWERSRALLSRLRGRVRIGVVSNFYGNLEVLLAEAGLAAALDTVVESARVGVEKPDPAIYRLAAERLGVPPRE